MSHPTLPRKSVSQIFGETIRENILAAYKHSNWNSTRAAEWLGVNRRTLLRWVNQHDLRTWIEEQRTEETKPKK